MNGQARWPLVLVIFDGWGVAPAGPGNAISQAKTPVMDELQRRFPATTLAAAGSAVGLPLRQAGNSEAGHMNIGAGRVVEQDSVRISQSINHGSFFKNAAFHAAIHHVAKHRSQLHLMGLLTAGQSAHADPDHLLALITLAREAKVRRIILHLFTDGRDSPPHAAIHLLRALNSMLRREETVATIVGRFYAMDRKKVWTRTKRTYEALTLGKGRRTDDAEAAILEAYERGESDEFIAPTAIGDRREHRIRQNDSVIYFNLRSDRARQLTKVFVQQHFSQLNRGSFERTRLPKNLLFVAMTDFGPDLGQIYTAFPSVDLYNTLPVVLRNRRQVYVAESEKYAHVTYFLNGGFDRPVAGEDRMLIPSPDVTSYDTVPAMSAHEITDVVVSDLKQGQHEVIVLNFANPDMVGHTGNLAATVQAVEVVDQCVGRIREAVSARQGTLVITADHGNAEEMLLPGAMDVDTEHSINPVPFVIVTSSPPPFRLAGGGRLADVAPTVLDLFGIQPPAVMTGRSLLENSHAA